MNVEFVGVCWSAYGEYGEYGVIYRNHQQTYSFMNMETKCHNNRSILILSMYYRYLIFMWRPKLLVFILEMQIHSHIVSYQNRTC